MAVATSSAVSVLVWSIILIAMVVVGLLAVSWVKKRIQQPDEPASAGFSLDDLRKLRRDGQISDEQYERARQRLIGGLQDEQR